MSRVKVITSKPIVRKIVVGTPVRRVVSVIGKDNLNEMNDVNSENLQEKSVLVWDEETEKWISTLTLNGQIVDGGDF